jgi:hypothetical protein
MLSVDWVWSCPPVEVLRGFIGGTLLMGDLPFALFLAKLNEVWNFRFDF